MPAAAPLPGCMRRLHPSVAEHKRCSVNALQSVPTYSNKAHNLLPAGIRRWKCGTCWCVFAVHASCSSSKSSCSSSSSCSSRRMRSMAAAAIRHARRAASAAPADQLCCSIALLEDITASPPVLAGPHVSCWPTSSTSNQRSLLPSSLLIAMTTQKFSRQLPVQALSLNDRLHGELHADKDATGFLNWMHVCSGLSEAGRSSFCDAAAEPAQWPGSLHP